MWYIVYMAVLNLRGVPEELARRLKANASLRGQTLLDYCVEVLSESSSVGGVGMRGGDGVPGGVRVAGSDADRKVHAVPKAKR